MSLTTRFSGRYPFKLGGMFAQALVPAVEAAALDLGGAAKVYAHPSTPRVDFFLTPTP